MVPPSTRRARIEFDIGHRPRTDLYAEWPYNAGL